MRKTCSNVMDVSLKNKSILKKEFIIVILVLSPSVQSVLKKHKHFGKKKTSLQAKSKTSKIFES